MLSTRTKVWLFLVVVCFAFLILGERLGGRAGLFIGFLLAVGLNALVFLWGESRILFALNAQKIEGRDAWNLRSTVDHYSQALGMESPNLYLMDSPTATAFSMGFSNRRPSLCVSTSLLSKFTASEIEAVLVQQLCHMSHTDSFGFGVSSIVSNSLLGVGQALDQFWPPNFFLGKKQKPVLSLLSVFTWVITRLVANSSTFANDDRTAAELLQSRERLGEVLWKLEGLAQTRPLTVPPATAHLFIVNPEGFQQRNFFLRSHPPLADRLRTLIGTPTV